MAHGRMHRWVLGGSATMLALAAAVTGAPPAFGYKCANPSGTSHMTVAADPAPVLTLQPCMYLDVGYGLQMDHQIQAYGGTLPYRWELKNDQLPVGLSFTADGRLVGMSTALGTTESAIRVRDASGQMAQGSLFITVKVLVRVQLYDPPVGEVGRPYSWPLFAEGGRGPYTWTITQGTLPDGITMTPGGLLSGTPTQAGNAVPVMFQATDADGLVGVRELWLSARDPLEINQSGLPNAQEGKPYEYHFAANAWGIPHWKALAPLPPGLRLSTDGALTGTPSKAGDYVVKVSVSDEINAGVPRTVSAEFPLRVMGSLRVKPRITIRLGVEEWIDRMLEYTGGTGTVIWKITGGALPPNFTFTQYGELIGESSKRGTWRWDVRVTDDTGKAVTSRITLIVA